MLKNIFITSAQRTAVGSFQGVYSQTPAVTLGTQAIQSALESAQILPEFVDECIMGQVLTAGCGQAPARQAALGAGLKTSTPCITINKVCGSGLKAVMMACDSIQLNKSALVVAGGQENMTLSPHLLTQSRQGYRMGHIQALDSMIHDGLWDPYNQFHMGNAAEMCSREYKISREEQDEFAKQSYEWALDAQKQGLFKNEISPVKIASRKTTLTITEDEEPSKANFEKMPQLRPAFEKEGTITAANASKINDGAAALTLCNEQKIKELSLKPLVKVTAYETFAQDPKWFTTAPVGAIKKALTSAGLSVEDIDLWEINEAFSNVTMVAMRELNIQREKVNIHGGAIAIGHPIGASGARILTTLVHALQTKNKTRGLASLCIGGGEAVAVIVERV